MFRGFFPQTDHFSLLSPPLIDPSLCLFLSPLLPLFTPLCVELTRFFFTSNAFWSEFNVPKIIYSVCRYSWVISSVDGVVKTVIPGRVPHWWHLSAVSFESSELPPQWSWRNWSRPELSQSIGIGQEASFSKKQLLSKWSALCLLPLKMEAFPPMSVCKPGSFYRTFPPLGSCCVLYKATTV